MARYGGPGPVDKALLMNGAPLVISCVVRV